MTEYYVFNGGQRSEINSLIAKISSRENGENIDFLRGKIRKLMEERKEELEKRFFGKKVKIIFESGEEIERIISGVSLRYLFFQTNDSSIIVPMININKIAISE